MKLGDLVIMRQSIKEYVAERGRTTGVVIGLNEPQVEPRLGLIMWPDGETENLYEDEVDIIGYSHETRRSSKR